MSIARATSDDPRGVIAESYHIEDLDEGAAKDIFLSWALSDAPSDPEVMKEALLRLWERFEPEYPDHPMTLLLAQSQNRSERRSSRRRK